MTELWHFFVQTNLDLSYFSIVRGPKQMWYIWCLPLNLNLIQNMTTGICYCWHHIFLSLRKFWHETMLSVTLFFLGIILLLWLCSMKKNHPVFVRFLCRSIQKSCSFCSFLDKKWVYSFLNKFIMYWKRAVFVQLKISLNFEMWKHVVFCAVFVYKKHAVFMQFLVCSFCAVFVRLFVQKSYS